MTGKKQDQAVQLDDTQLEGAQGGHIYIKFDRAPAPSQIKSSTSGILDGTSNILDGSSNTRI